MADLHTKEALPSRRQRSYSDVDQVEDEMEFLRRAFDRARATLNELMSTLLPLTCC
jgi:sentrin-specific protease 1